MRCAWTKFIRQGGKARAAGQDRQGSGTVGWAGRRPNLWAGTAAEGGGLEAMVSGSR